MGIRFTCSVGDEPCDKVTGARENSIQCEACMVWTEGVKDLGLTQNTRICVQKLLMQLGSMSCYGFTMTFLAEWNA